MTPVEPPDPLESELRRAEFLLSQGWVDAMIDPIPGDASFRRYFRLRSADGRRALLMDAPAPQENLSAFVRVDQLLASFGLRVPALLSVDVDQGLALIEDLGDGTFTRVLEDSPAREGDLYDMALEALLHLNASATTSAIDLPDYDARHLLDEAALLVDWFVPAYAGEVTEVARDAYLAAWSDALAFIPSEPRTLVLRDYHVDNLIEVPSGQGVGRCGLLDFQDAVLGHPAYDLASLLEDARRDLPDALRNRLYSRFSSECDCGNDFDDAYAVLAAQRHAKVLGIFVRLCRRDGKPIYLQHLPRLAGLLRRHIDKRPLAAVQAWLAAHCPDLLDSDFVPDPDRCF